jgi:uncharacterized protein YkwD
MKNISLLSLFVLLSLLLAACGSNPAGPKQRFQPYPEESQLLGLTNDFRAQARTCGTLAFPAAPALTWVEAVGDVAWFHSLDMAGADTENHVGASAVERMKARGFEADTAAENRKKTALPANPQEAFNAWTADPEACANIMNPAFTRMGAGYAGHHDGFTSAYWTQLLTAPKGNNPAPSLTVNPTTATATVGGAAIPFAATLLNSVETINWTLAGPGSISSATGATTNYTPPATGNAGTATLTATAGALTATATITINAAAPGLTVTPATVTVAVGSAPIQFKASSNQVTWSLTGLHGGWAWQGDTFTYTPPATGIGGTATITATLGALTASATVTITSLSLTPPTATVMIGGPAVAFSATLTNSAETINWTLTGPGSISSTTGATTSYTPPATGTPGSATLTATAGTLTASATLTIAPAFPEAFLALINAFRAQPQVCKNGTVDQNMPAVPPVSLHALLNQAAQGHSQDMATNNFFSHTGSNGSTFSQRIAATGYTGAPGGENIAAGSETAQGAFDSWRTSTAGHCQGMMNANINEIGIGYARNAASTWTHYWTLVTGNRTP